MYCVAVIIIVTTNAVSGGKLALNSKYVVGSIINDHILVIICNFLMSPCAWNATPKLLENSSIIEMIINNLVKVAERGG